MTRTTNPTGATVQADEAQHHLTQTEPASLIERSLHVMRLALEQAVQQLEAEASLPDIADPERLRRELEIPLGAEGRTVEQVMAMVGRVIRSTPSASSPRFLNQLFGGREPVATAAEMLAGLTNTSMYTYKVGGPQVLIEQEVLSRMAHLAGLDAGQGTFLPGGSMSNLTAMLIARNEALGDVREHGLDGARLTVYTSDQSHYSIRKNAGILGIGRANARIVPTDDEGRMRPDELERLITEDLAAGARPIMVNATSGTTVLGAFDPLREVAAVARRHGLWLHVDACLGGSFLLCPELRPLLDGSELADSLAWNAHKMMGVGLQCSALILARGGLLARHLNESADYLFQAHEDELNPGTRSLQCGRRNDALKLWAAWQLLGDEGYAERVRRQRGLVRRAVALINADPDLDLVLQPACLNVCFEVRGADARDICTRLDEERRLKIGYGETKGRRFIRLVCVNPELDGSDLAMIFEEIHTVARALCR